MKKMPDDLKKLEERIRELKEKESRVNRDKGESEFMHASKAGLRVGAELLSGVLVGGAIGYFLDGFFDTKPWLLVLFLFFGGGAGVLNVYRFVKKEESRN